MEKGTPFSKSLLEATLKRFLRVYVKESLSAQSLVAGGLSIESFGLWFEARFEVTGWYGNFCMKKNNWKFWLFFKKKSDKVTG